MSKVFKSVADIAALVLIGGCLALRFSGIDSEVMSILAMAAGWAFRSGYQAIKERRKNNGEAKESTPVP